MADIHDSDDVRTVNNVESTPMAREAAANAELWHRVARGEAEVIAPNDARILQSFGYADGLYHFGAEDDDKAFHVGYRGEALFTVRHASG